MSLNQIKTTFFLLFENTIHDSNDKRTYKLFSEKNVKKSKHDIFDQMSIIFKTFFELQKVRNF